MEYNPQDELSKYKFLKKLKQFPPVEKIYLFGSRVDENHPLRADIDLSIVCPQASIRDWNAIMEIVENADTLLEIDCVRYDEITDPRFKQAVDDHHVLLFKRGEP